MTALQAPSRARVRRAEIWHAMIQQRWERGSAATVAQRYGVSADSVADEAMIISDIVEECGGDVETVRAEIAASLRRIEAEAEELGREARDEGEYSGAVAALGVRVKSLDTRARHRGIGVPTAARSKDDPPNADATATLREMLREPPPWLLDMLTAAGWMRLESR